MNDLEVGSPELPDELPEGPLPNGKGVLMTVSHGGPGGGGSELDEIAVLDLTTRTHRVLVRGVFARYVRSGHLIYVTADGALMGVTFDQDRMEMTGDPVALTDGVGVRRGGGAADLALSGSGTLWYVAGAIGTAGLMEVAWVGRDGSATPVTAGWTGIIANPVLSPDGRRLAVNIQEAVAQVWIKELGQGPLSKLTVEGSNSLRPAWLADGRSVAYVSDRSASRDLYLRSADGSRPEELLLDVERPVEEATFSRDGAWVVYRTGSFVLEGDLYARRLGTDSSITLVATQGFETSPALSPDGRWLAYASNESGTEEVYVRPFPNTGGGRWQISVQGGQEPVWAHSGRELFYRTTGAAPQQMVMDISPGQAFVPGARRVLFSLNRFVVGGNHQQYAVTPDDRRFIMLRLTGSARPDQVVVVENFSDELRARTRRKP